MVDPEDFDTRLSEISDAKEFYLDEWDHGANHALASTMPGSDITTWHDGMHTNAIWRTT